MDVVLQPLHFAGSKLDCVGRKPTCVFAVWSVHSVDYCEHLYGIGLSRFYVFSIGLPSETTSNSDR